MAPLNGWQRYSFGIFSTLICTLLFTASFAGCSSKEKLPYYFPAETNTDSTQKTYLALGDSYTIGESVPETDRYPVQLAAWLNARSIKVAKPPIIATTGWTTQNLLSAIASANPPANYDIVTLLIGVNNQYQTRDTAGYREQFRLCLQKAIQLAGGRASRVFVLSIPDYGATPFGGSSTTGTISQQIDQYNAINKAVTLEYAVSYTDITPSTRMAISDAGLVSADGLHPSGKEYKKWVDMLGPKVLAVLK